MTQTGTQQKNVFPRRGEQVRRKTDGSLGEVYASNPGKDVLTIRWPTIPGAYDTRDYTLAQFAQNWELTGVRLEQPHPSRYAPGIIAMVMLLFFIFVLVKTKWGSYTAYNASKILAADRVAPLDNAQTLDQNYGAEAAAQCDAGVDLYLHDLVGDNYKWNQTAMTGSKFATYRASVTAPGILTMVSDKAEFSNGAGGLHPVEISCDYDTQRQEVIHYSVQTIGP